MNKKVITTLILSLAFVLSLAACGGQTGGQSAASVGASTTPVDGCALITTADAQALYNQKMAEPRHMESGELGKSGVGYMSTCNYHTESTDNFKTASILARQSLNEEEAKIAFEQGRKESQAMQHTFQLMPEFGPDAYFDVEFSQIHLLKGNIWIMISADAPDGADAQTAVKQLAQIALGRL